MAPSARLNRILIHSGKHPFDPIDPSLPLHTTMAIMGDNTGNLLFADAIFKYLYTARRQQLDSDGYRFATEDPAMSADAINDQYDCVVIPAANWLSGYFRHRLPAMTAKIRQLKIPCVVIGLGAQAGATGDFSVLQRIEPEAKAFLRAVSDRSHSIGVRGHFTAECVRHLGFQNVNVTGCPSLYRNLDQFSVVKKPVTREEFRLAVNGTSKLLQGLGPNLFDLYRSVYFSQGGLLTLLKRRWRTPLSEWKQRLGDGFSLKLITEGRIRCYGDITPWIEELKHYHLSLGTRIHGNIIALLAGVPAVVIAHDSRTREMADLYHIPHVSLHSLRRGFDPYDLYQWADFGPLHAHYREKLRNMARFLSDNGLAHTLLQHNGRTPFDARVRELQFSPYTYPQDHAAFALGRRLSRPVAGLKTLKHQILRTAVTGAQVALFAA